MPGKHAPASSKSYFLSLGAAVGGMLGALALVLALVLVALNAGGNNSKETGSPAISPRPTPTTSTSASPTQTAKASATATAAAAPSVLPASRVSLSVLNGTKRTGLAASFAKQAKDAGYPVTRTGNAPQAFTKSTIYYRGDVQEEALAFQKRFGQFTVIAPLPSGYASDVVLTIVLGADFP